MAKSISLPLASYAKLNINMGQFEKKRVQWALGFPSLQSSRRIHGTPTESMPL
jgi:hypothetical protein